MKGLKQVSNLSKTGKVSLYYSFASDTVYTEPGEGRCHVTELINENTPQDIENFVNFWKNL